jgi:hypothetical protein
MELVVVTWGFRLTFLALAAVTGVSIASDASIIDAVVRGVAVALVFTFATRWLLDRLEPPERRLMRLRARRAGKRDKVERKGKIDAANAAADGAAKGRKAKDEKGAKGKPAAGAATAAVRGRAA